MRHLICLLALIGMMFSISACSTEVSEGGQGAADAYISFTQLLRDCSSDASACDKEAIWNSMDAQSKSSFLEAYTALVRIDRMIETYFDPIEHKYMKSKTGTDILVSANIKEFKDLYLYLFKPEALQFNENVNSGLEIAGDTVENANKVVIHPHHGQSQIVMIRESDGVWRTAMLLDAIHASVEPILASEQAMREYAKGNLEAEFKRRLEVRDYFIEQHDLKKKQEEARLRPKAVEETPEAAETESES
ncbi:MAG: hypothetical protein J6S69_07810 [Proteobacteria bacterium]|jgi:hypothetical protein|nr:hypothetical protein [Pseudomonadota bacterium]